MAKAKPKEKSSDTPLERTAKLARKLLAVPKREVENQQRKYDAQKARRTD